MSVSLTAAAADHVRRCIAERTRRRNPPRRPPLRLLRAVVCGGICRPHARGRPHFDSRGITIITDPKSLVHIAGMEVDYVREGLQAGLKFNNPNVKDSCGCGVSFNT